MSPTRPALRRFGLGLPLAVLMVGGLGLIRLGRQFPAAASSPALLIPFLFPVLALALEAGALVALSLAELSALLGSRELSVGARVRAMLPLLGAVLLVFAVAELVPRGTEEPGAFANQLVESARGSCGDSGKVPVPLLGLSVTCGKDSRLEGPMPGVRGAQVAMRDLRFSSDLRRVEIIDLDLTVPRSLRVHLRARTARVAGLAPWSRSPRFSPLFRFSILTAVALALWLAGCLCLGRRAPGEAALAGVSVSVSVSVASHWARGLRLLVGLLLSAPGAIAAAGVISLDQDRAAPAAYVSAALLGLLATGLVALLEWRLPKIFSYFRSF